MVSLDLYTQNIPLTQKAKFWTNYVSSLKGDAIIHVQFIILNNLLSDNTIFSGASLCYYANQPACPL